MALTREINPEVVPAVEALEGYLRGLGYSVTRNLARLTITTAGGVQAAVEVVTRTQRRSLLAPLERVIRVDVEPRALWRGVSYRTDRAGWEERVRARLDSFGG